MVFRTGLGRPSPTALAQQRKTDWGTTCFKVGWFHPAIESLPPALVLITRMLPRILALPHMVNSSATLTGPSDQAPVHSLSSRLPFYYGWVMLPVAMIAHISTFPGQTPGISVFNPSFREALNLSHSQLTGVYMLGSFLACLPMVAVGALMDRYGIRRTMACVVVLFGGACLFTSQVTNLVALGLAFLMLRTLGQGALMLLSDNTLPMWFRARLGVVSGLKSWAWPIAISVVPGFTLC